MIHYNLVCLSTDEVLKIERVINAACKYYDIDIEKMLASSDRGIVKVRYYCLFLIKEDINLNDYNLGLLFGRAKSTIQYGIETVTRQKNVYAEINFNLRKIREGYFPFQLN